MTLAGLVGRLGLAEVARRAGVSVATLQRWMRHGPSAKGLATLSRIAARHEGSRWAAVTRKKRAAFPGSLPLPPESYVVISPVPRPSSGFLSEAEVLPNEPPVKTRADLSRVRKSAGYSGARRINTNEYVGESQWITIGKPILEVDVEGLGRQVAEAWRYSRRTWVQAIFLMFRYIPFNSTYKGEMVNKQGRWFDWWTSTAIHGDDQTIRNAVEVALGGAVAAGYNRVIWIEAMNIRTFDHKADLPTQSAVTRKTLR